MASMRKRSNSNTITVSQIISDRDPHQAVEWARNSAEQFVIDSKKSVSEIREKLIHWDDLPAHLKWNEHIVKGYRHQLTYWECFRSLFEIHNESGNVWSHLIGMLIFAYFAYDVIFLKMGTFDLIHKIIFAIYFASAMYAFGCSTLYHLFMCHCEESHMQCYLRMDYSGIAALIVGSYIPPLYYSYYCFPSWQRLYLGIMGGAGLTLTIMAAFPFFHSHAFHRFRMILFLFTAGFGVIPSLHMNFLPSIQGEIYDRWDVYKRIYLMYFFYVVGVFCYAFRFPERYRPGKHDIWLSSHQLWHIFVLVATLVHFGTIGMIFENWQAVMSFNDGTCLF